MILPSRPPDPILRSRHPFFLPLATADLLGYRRKKTEDPRRVRSRTWGPDSSSSIEGDGPIASACKLSSSLGDSTKDTSLPYSKDDIVMGSDSTMSKSDQTIPKNDKRKKEEERKRKKELKLQEREKKKKLKEQLKQNKKKEKDKKKGKGKDDLPDHHLHLTWEKREAIIDDVPELEFVPLVPFEPECFVGENGDCVLGPTADEGVANLQLGTGECIMSGRTVSSYPRILEAPGLRQGDPICDCFGGRSFTNGHIFCVADGCGWGHSVRDAAVAARTTFLDRVEEGLPRCRSIRDIAHLLLKTLARAHNNIMEGKSAFEAGTTTLVAAVVCRLRSDLLSEMRDEMSNTVTGSTIVRLEIHDAVNTWGGDNVAAAGKGRGRKLSIPFRPMGKRTGGKKKMGSSSPLKISERREDKSSALADTNRTREQRISRSQNLILTPKIIPRSEKIFNSSPAVSSRHDMNSSEELPEGEESVADMVKKRHVDVVRKRPGWCVVFLSLGDCKLFRRTAEGRMIDLTTGNRLDIRDPRDCGGRIGPSQEDEDHPGLPDLRNLDLGFDLCNDGDLLLGLSDGVYDNIDPEFTGKSPSSFGLDAEGWDGILPEELERVKSQFCQDTLLALSSRSSPFPYPLGGGSYVGEAKEREAGVGLAKEGDSKVGSPGAKDSAIPAEREESEGETPGEEPLKGTSNPDALPGGDLPELQVVTESVINYALSTTSKLRSWMEDNPGRRQPKEAELYPGKLDHTTCLSVRIGKVG